MGRIKILAPTDPIIQRIPSWIQQSSADLPILLPILPNVHPFLVKSLPIVKGQTDSKNLSGHKSIRSNQNNPYGKTKVQIKYVNLSRVSYHQPILPKIVSREAGDMHRNGPRAGAGRRSSRGRGWGAPGSGS